MIHKQPTYISKHGMPWDMEWCFKSYQTNYGVAAIITLQQRWIAIWKTKKYSKLANWLAGSFMCSNVKTKGQEKKQPGKAS